MVSNVKKFLENHIAFLILLGVGLLCAMFLMLGTASENGYITLNGKDAKIEEYTEKFIEDANAALYRLMNEDKPTDEITSTVFDEPAGQGYATTLEQVIARRKPDGFNDDGKGLQCSKYTAYLATGRMEYSTTHPDYGPVNGKDVVNYLVRNYGWKYIETPVAGAIGSGGFNTLYGHTAMYLYSLGGNLAMVNDANYTPLAVSTHPMDISGWIWAVPGDYTPTPEPTPEPPVEPVADCKSINVVVGDSMGKIMLECEGYVEYGKAMQEYAKTWFSTLVKPGQSVYEGWMSAGGVGLYAGDVIERRGVE